MPRRHRDPDSPRPMPAGHVIVVVVIALLGGSILNAQALTEAAANQPFGWKRTVAVVAATPVRGIAGLLGLDEAHGALADVAAEAVGGPAVGANADAVPSEAEDVEVASAPAPSAEPSSPARAAAPPPTAPAPTEAERRAPTRRNPLRVWVGGDSLSSEFGPALSDRLARTERAEADVEFRFSTGLARPDFFDWPERLREIAADQDPDVFVAVFGANDAQNLEVDGQVLPYPTPAWQREYARRVGEVMDILADGRRTVLWVGQPVMRAPDFDQKMQLLNGIYARQARGRDTVRYVDTRRLFSDGGAFAAYLVDDSGQPALMRQQDGIHFTRAGGERLTDVVFDLIADDWSLGADPGDR